MTVLAIDPGKKGGVTVNPLAGSYTPVCYPLVYKDSEVDTGALMELLEATEPTCVVIEAQVIYRGQGAKSSATTMRNYGRLLGVVESYALHRSVGILTPTPRDWKCHIIPNTPRGMGKEAAIKFCQDNYPDVSLLRTNRSKVPCDGLADSLCMWHWAVHIQ